MIPSYKGTFPLLRGVRGVFLESHKSQTNTQTQRQGQGKSQRQGQSLGQRKKKNQ